MSATAVTSSPLLDFDIPQRPASPLSLSSRSYFTSSSISTSSSTDPSFGSTSTIWGPGALAGKGIKSLGEATLRLAENITIRRRLAAIEAAFPCHDARIPGGVHERMCEEVLELARAGFYDEGIRQRAMSCIISQIDAGSTHGLLVSLSKWPSVEIELFVDTLLAAPYTTSCPLHGDGHDRTISTLLLSTRTTPAKYRFLVFLVHVSCMSASVAFHLVYDHDVLTMILRVALGKDVTWIYSASDVLEICNRAFTAQQAVFEPAVRMHPIYTLWPRTQLFFLPRPTATPTKPDWHRRAAWASITLADHRMRLARLTTHWSVSPSHDEYHAMDACVDLLFFAALGGREGEEAMRLLVRDLSASRDVREAYRACLKERGRELTGVHAAVAVRCPAALGLTDVHDDERGEGCS